MIDSNSENRPPSFTADPNKGPLNKRIAETQGRRVSDPEPQPQHPLKDETVKSLEEVGKELALRQLRQGQNESRVRINELVAALEEANRAKEAAQTEKELADRRAEIERLQAGFATVTAHQAQEMAMQAQEAAYTADGGFLNRKWLLETTEKQIEQAKITGQPVHIVFLDLDRFKDYNSYYSYDGGNKVLELMHTLPYREKETVARYGGDEFAQLLTEPIQPTDFFPLTQRYQQTLDRNSKTLLATLPLDENRKKDELPDENRPTEVTMSLGVAIWEGESAEDLIKKASVAAKYSKDHGKDHATYIRKNPENDPEQPFIFQRIDEQFALAA